MSTIREAVDRYLHSLEFERRVSSTTLKNYRSSLNRFAAWLGDRPFSDETVAQYLATFSHAASANVIGVRLHGLSRHMKHPIEIVRAKEAVRPVEALTPDEIQRLINASRKLNKNFTPVIILLAETGLRFSEFCSLTPSSLKRRGRVAWIEVVGKGLKLRKVPLSSVALDAFHQLPFSPCWWEQDKIRRHFTRAGQLAKLPFRVHPHLLRASFITNMLNQRHEAIKVAKIVGHAGLGTMLKHYFSESIEDLHAMVS